MADWFANGLADDIRPQMFGAAARAEAFALATIVAADGGPRPVGSQLVATADDCWGFLSGGCIEADVALHGRELLAAGGGVRRLVYGRGSPFVDMRLPCGGRVEILVERVGHDEPALRTLRSLSEARRPVIWQSDGERRACGAPEAIAADATMRVRRRYDPPQRLVVIGSDPFALAIAALGTQIGWDARLLNPHGPAGEAPYGVDCDRRPLDIALDALAPDRWTAIAIATHEAEMDIAAIVAALDTAAAYIGVVGSRRRIGERIARLHAAGIGDAAIDRLHMPIGLPIPARAPWEIALAVIAEILSLRRADDGASVPVHAIQSA
jgi:xanthine dehydrogenase accessory factor